MFNRVFLIVLDSFGIGALPDAEKFGDEGSNTLKAIRNHTYFNCPNLKQLGLFNIESVGGGVKNPTGCFARMAEASAGKDTTTGHFEIGGIISKTAMPTYPNGFPDEIISVFEKEIGKKVICNKPYSGTEVIKDYGKEHIKTGNLIVYTSADSVFQIAAHTSVVPLADLYNYCKIARKILCDKHAVGRVIARPFTGDWPYTRTADRHDFSLLPPSDTILNIISKSGMETRAVGKIYDIYAGSGITASYKSKSNTEGMLITSKIVKENFKGLCFVNLVDFDMLYGHRNDICGYAKALSEFDLWLGGFLKQLDNNDVLIITADHGCDPSTPSTDHSREYVPMLMFGQGIKQGINLGTLKTFADVGSTVLEALGLNAENICGNSFLNACIKK